MNVLFYLSLQRADSISVVCPDSQQLCSRPVQTLLQTRLLERQQKKWINLYLCFYFLFLIRKPDYKDIAWSSSVGPWNKTTPQWACQLTAMRYCHKVDPRLLLTSCSSSCRCSSWLRFPCSRLSNDVTFFWRSTNKRSLSSTVTAAWWWSNKPMTGKEHLV